MADNHEDRSSLELCHDCDSIKFGALGFFKVHKGRNVSAKVVGQTFTRLAESIRDTSQTCAFCAQLFGLIQDGLLKHLGRRLEGLEYVQSSATFQDHIIASQSPANTEYLKRSPDRVLRLMITFRVEEPSIDGQLLDVGKDKKFRLSYYYQRAFDSPVSVDETLADGFEPTKHHLGRLRPLVADMSLFRRWKDTCSSSHLCGSVRDDSLRTVTLRLIDVDKLCIETHPSPEQWACLSYVWGSADLPLLTRKSQAIFEEPGALQGDVLPPAFQDAIRVTKEIGIRYLWIDCLCILQDDADDKNHYISGMDSIFKHAFIVLVAASNENANTGLPGIRPQSRSTEQQIMQFRGTPVVRSLDASARHGQSYVGQTLWTSRAWTFQERFFACRALIFAEEQVYWECRHSFWAEELCSEFDKDTQLWRSTLNVKRSSVPRELLGKASFRHNYKELVEEYMSRNLTNDDDGLAAFAGLLREFEAVTGESFLWGIPRTYLQESVLTWRSLWTPSERSRGSVWAPPRRRQGTVRSGRDGQMAEFPSWSWVGWVGKIGLTPLMSRLEVILRIYLVDAQGHPTALVADTKEDLGSIVSSTFHHKKQQRVEVLAEDIPQLSVLPLVYSSLLCFWTESVSVRITGGENEHQVLRHPGSGKRLFSFWRQIPYPTLPVDQTVELVAVARDTKNSIRQWNGRDGGIGALVVIRGDGITYRVGLVWLYLVEWRSIPTRKWELVLLG